MSNDAWNGCVFGNKKKWDFKPDKRQRAHKWELIVVPRNKKKYISRVTKKLRKLRKDLQLAKGTHSTRKFYVTIWDLNYLPRWNDLIEMQLQGHGRKLRRQILFCIGQKTRPNTLCDWEIFKLVHSLHIPRLTIISWEDEISEPQLMYLTALLQGTIKKSICNLTVE